MSGLAAPAFQATGPVPVIQPARPRVLQRSCDCGNHTPGGEECESCKNKRGLLQRSPADGVTGLGVPGIVHDVLRQPGRSLDSDTRSFFEPRFGRDFSGVRVHTGDRAAASAAAVHASAYTVGNDIVFGGGRYGPSSPEGRRLLAHELTHVQQQAGAPAPADLTIGPAHDSHEAQAGAIADRVANSATPASAAVAGPASAGMLQRQTAPGDELMQPGQASPGPTPADGIGDHLLGPSGSGLNRRMPAEAKDYYVNRFGKFDAELFQAGEGPGASGTICALHVTTRVKLMQDDSKGVWPAGKFARWRGQFAESIEKHWSTRYLLLPDGDCSHLNCTAAAVYVHVQLVDSNEQHKVKVYHDDSATRVRSHAGIPSPDPTDRPGELNEEDIRPDDRLGQTTIHHEAGHWFGLQHIRCNGKEDECYGISTAETDDIMGLGTYVSARDYQTFIQVLHDITLCNWKIGPGLGGPRGGTMALGYGLAGGLFGAALGAAVLGIPGMILGGLIGAGIGLLTGSHTHSSTKRSE